MKRKNMNKGIVFQPSSICLKQTPLKWFAWSPIHSHFSLSAVILHFIFSVFSAENSPTPTNRWQRAFPLLQADRPPLLPSVQHTRVSWTSSARRPGTLPSRDLRDSSFCEFRYLSQRKPQTWGATHTLLLTPASQLMWKL